MMDELNVMSVNTNGLSTPVKRHKLSKLLKENQVHLALLQETHKKKDKSKLINERNWELQFESRGSNKSRGVAILIKDNLNFELEKVIKDTEGRFIMIIGKINNSQVTIASVYAPNQRQVKFINKICTKIKKQALGDIIVGGDLNLQLYENNNNKGTGIEAKCKINFRKWNLIEANNRIGERIDSPTFFSHRHSTFTTIDYFLVGINNVMPIKEIMVGKQWPGDHAPLYLKLGNYIKNTVKKWRFNPKVAYKETDRKGIKDQIIEYFNLNRSPGMKESIVWDAFKAVIRGKCITIERGINKRENERFRKLRLEEEKAFQAFQKDQTVGKKEKWLEIKKQLENLEEIEVTKKYIWVKNDFQINSINNTKKLANLLKKKQGKAKIIKLKDRNGQIKTREEDLKEIMANYYEKLYMNKDTVSSEGILNKKLDTFSQAVLDSNITSNEIEEVIKNLKINSSPGPDGLTTNFYKIFQKEVIPNLQILYNKIMENKIIPETWKKSEIITILKPNKEETDPNSYRPITLSNVDYKIFTKIIANRLREIMPTLIEEDQYGFIKKRMIADPIRNIVNVIDHATRERRKLLLIKLDVYKAFDTINHNYLANLCEECNLGKNICGVIRELYKENQAEIIVNGSNSRTIEIKSGTKQGCPLSPLLFALAIEPLANLIRSDKSIKGYRIDREEIKINLYADDAMVLIGTMDDSVKAVKKVIKKFESISGLVINIEKSEILHKNLTWKELKEAQSTLGVKLGGKKLKYLGIHISKNLNNIIQINYNPLWKKISKQIIDWKKWNWNITTRLKAYKMMILPKFLYLFQTLPFSIPPKIIKKWDNSIKTWIIGASKNRIANTVFFTQQVNGGWGAPCLQNYFEACQLARLLELDIGEPKRWVRLEKLMNGWEYGSCLIGKIGNKDLKNIKGGPLTSTMECWRKWQNKLPINKIDKLPIGALENRKPQLYRNMIKNLEQHGITKIEDLLKSDGTVIQWEEIKDKCGQGNWLQWGGLSKKITDWKNKETPESDLDKIIKWKVEKEKGIMGYIYKIIMEKQYNTKYTLIEIWKEDLNCNEREIEKWIKSINKIKYLKIKEMQLKILTKWYRTPIQLAYITETHPKQCWHNCGKIGTYTHMWWECEKIQRFYNIIKKEMKELLGTKIEWNKTQFFVQKLEGNGELKEWEEIIKHMLDAIKASVALGWKDKKKWDIKTWYKYLADYLLQDYISERKSYYKFGQTKMTWEAKWKGLISRVKGKDKYKELNKIILMIEQL
uniref:Reverse transcriptase domain-containing protein n=1 Tax=Anolis carolinensis TaxID=28377 RepID=R4G9D5_ANOCA